MTHKKPEPILEENKEADQDLLDMLAEAESESEQKEEHKKSDSSFQKIHHLEALLTEKDEIVKNAQINYLHLKSDFDILQRQTLEKEKTIEMDSLIKIAKKILPAIEDLRKSLLTLDEDQKTSPMGQGVNMVYEKLLSSLKDLHIYPISSLGEAPDSLLHEPVSTMPTEDISLKGKIVQEFEGGFVYEKNGEKKVILPAKVIVGI